MFDHVKFGVSDYAASKAFFLKALEPLGVAVVSEGPPTYGVELSPKGKASLCLYQTEEKPAHLHLAFTARIAGAAIGARQAGALAALTQDPTLQPQASARRQATARAPIDSEQGRVARRCRSGDEQSGGQKCGRTDARGIAAGARENCGRRGLTRKANVVTM
jgi:hypothetical protein